MFCEITQDLYDNGTVNTVGITQPITTLKVQSNASITYSIQGRLGNDYSYVDITGIKDNGLSTATSIADNDIYSFDITGYSSVKLNTLSSANGKVTGRFFGER